MILKLKVNGTLIDMAVKGIKLNSVQTMVESGQPMFDFFIVTPVMPSPASGFNADNPWTYNAKEVELIAQKNTDANVTRTLFLGDAMQVNPSYRDNNLNGFSVSCVGFGNRAERIPILNPFDLSTSITFNMDRRSFDYDSLLDGKNLGQAIKMLLTGYDTATRLIANGYTGMFTATGSSSSAATLVDDLETELGLLTTRPVSPINFSGENLLGSIQSLLDAYDPNYRCIADPHERRFKIYDKRRTSKKTYTLGTDPIDGFRHNRDTSVSYKSVRIRGSANIRPYLAHWNMGIDTTYPKGFKTGNLIEQFQYGTKSSDTAKASWKLGDFENQVVVKADENGIYWPSPGEYVPCASQTPPYACKPTSMPQADEVELNAAAFSTHPETDIGGPLAWAQNEWAQTSSGSTVARQGRLSIRRVFRWNGTETATLKKGDVMWQVEDRFLVVGNDPYPNVIQKCDGTNCTYDKIRFKLDRPHGIAPSDVTPPSDITATPSNYKEEWSFELTGYNPSGAVVWRRYKVNFGTNTQASNAYGVTRKIMKSFPEPVPWRSADGSSVVMVSSPQAAIVWSKTYAKPFNEWPINFYIDRENNQIIFTPPVVRVFGTRSKLETGGFNNTITPPWGTYNSSTGTTNQTIDGVPYDIRVLLPVADGILSTVYPPTTANLTDNRPDGKPYYGTAARYEGVTKILEVSMPQWVNSSDGANMDAYAQQLYESVKDTIVHGEFQYIQEIDPFVESWHPYWLPSQSFTGTDGQPHNRPLLPSVSVAMADTTVCDTGIGVLSEDELLLTAVELRFNEGVGGKSMTTVMQYSNQKAPWVSPQMGFDFYRQSITADSMEGWIEMQRNASPIL
jgi:hypothetical protein